MARKNGINGNNIENARDAKATWEHLGDVAEMLDEVYDEQLFEKHFDERFPDKDSIKDFNEKCVELIKAYHKMNKVKIQEKIETLETELAKLKESIA